MWICPSCQLPLHLDKNVWRCSAKHSFDQGKEGYVNLLLAQDRNSKSPGDNKDMILARRMFLQGGYYDPLVEKLIEVIANNQAGPDLTLFDAGCGEGYYLDKIRAGLVKQHYNCKALGSDISKVAIQRAAKTYKECDFSVASTFKIPLAGGSMSTVVQVFAPASEQHIARILQDNGIWLSVNPAPEHLQELKQVVYKDSHAHTTEDYNSDLFETLDRQTLRFQFSLEDPIEREALLKMTPFYWRASEQAKIDFVHASFSLTADFDIHLLRKINEQ
jgi:23S rRNA (guanine745-N1)-methyltransferase